VNVGLLPDTRKKSRVGLATCIRRFATIGKGIRKIQLVPHFFSMPLKPLRFSPRFFRRLPKSPGNILTV